MPDPTKVEMMPATSAGSEGVSPSASSSAATSLSGRKLSKRQSWRAEDLATSASRELQVTCTLP